MVYRTRPHYDCGGSTAIAMWPALQYTDVPRHSALRWWGAAFIKVSVVGEASVSEALAPKEV